MKISNIMIRPYRDEDWPRLMAIHDSARRDELHLAGLDGAFLPLSVAAEREGLFEYGLAVAELDGQAAGFAAWSEDELAWLYVDPALSRRGVGRALVEHAIAQIPERPISIEVLAGNAPALSLYRSCGFQEADTASGKMPGNEKFSVTCHVLQLP